MYESSEIRLSSSSSRSQAFASALQSPGIRHDGVFSPFDDLDHPSLHVDLLFDRRTSHAPHTYRSTTSCIRSQAAAGLSRGAVLEVMGPSGVGKSRLALGFVMGERFWKDAGEILVVDAEGSLSPASLKETAKAYGGHHGRESSTKKLQTRDPDLIIPFTTDDELSVREVLDGIRYQRVDSVWMRFAFFHSLEAWLVDHPRVIFVIIDSLTTHFPPHLDNSTRTLLAEVIRTTLSSVLPLAVIVTTSLSLKFFGPDHRPTSWSRDAEAPLVPQITEKWMPENMSGGGGAVWRLLLYYSEGGERLARLVSSPVPAQATDAAFTMDLLGPCDYPEPPVDQVERMEEDEGEGPDSPT
ncbi:hypothetical protein JCM11641_000777 [Rhodosporidiobolus odoratus]